MEEAEEFHPDTATAADGEQAADPATNEPFADVAATDGAPASEPDTGREEADAPAAEMPPVDEPVEDRRAMHGEAADEPPILEQGTEEPATEGTLVEEPAPPVPMNIASGATSPKTNESGTNRAATNKSQKSRPMTNEQIMDEPATTGSRTGERLTEVQGAEFPALEPGAAGGRSDRKMDLLLDLSLPVSIELGRTQMLIRDILELQRGSVVEFEKLASEPVDILINGKKMAEGEVVVIEKHFGIRITNLVEAIDRVKSLGK